MTTQEKIVLVKAIIESIDISWQQAIMDGNTDLSDQCHECSNIAYTLLSEYEADLVEAAKS